MNIAIIGATGKFGRIFTSKLITNPDNHLTLISKSAANKYEDNPWMTAKNIDATKQNDLKKVLKDIDLVFCAVSGVDQAVIARNLVELNVNRLIYISVVGIYNELAEGNGAEFNVKNEPEQIPNRNAVALIENSSLDYTIIRSGYLVHSDKDESVITKKGETPKGYVSNSKSIEKVVLEIIENPELYSRESISVTRDMS